jgi:Spy/CpxP family protein refolding chaperone
MNPISPAEPPRWNVALIVSICVNLLLAGIIATAVFRFAMHAPMGPSHRGGPWMIGIPGPGQTERQQVRQLMSPHVLMRLAPDKAQAIRALMKGHHAEIDALRNASIDARREVVRVYTAHDFDRAAFEKALSRMQMADAALEIAALKSTAEASVVLTPDERKAVVQWQPPHGPHGSGWHGQGNPEPDFDRGPEPGGH